MVDAAALAAVKQRYVALSPHLDERKRRLMVAAETVALGPRSMAAVSGGDGHGAHDDHARDQGTAAAFAHR